MRKNMVVCVVALAFCSFAIPTMAQNQFDQTADWPQLGSSKVEGSVEFDNGTYTLQGNGNDIWGNADEGFYTYTEKSGSWSISAKVEWIDPGSIDWAKLGVMIRDNGQAAGSKHFSFVARGANDLLAPQMRQTTDGVSRGGTAVDEGTQVAVPDGGVWLRVSRWAPMDFFWAEYSTDGSEWKLALTDTIEMSDDISVGLAITNHEDNDFLAEGTAEDVVIEEITEFPSHIIGGPVGDFEHHVDIGDFRWRGDASFADGVYTVNSGGSDIWGGDDDMHYVYKEMSGNFEVEAEMEITATGGTSEWYRAGMMARENLSMSAKYGMVLVNAAHNSRVATRSSYGGGVSTAGGVGVDVHHWKFKMVKLSGVTIGYYEDDNGDWVEIGRVTDNITSDTFLFGLALGGHQGFDVEGEFRNVSITEYPWAVNRTTPVANWTANLVVPVEVNIDVRDGASANNLEIVETIPEGTSVSNVSVTGGQVSEADGVITWTYSGSEDATLSYDLQTPGTRTAENNFLSWSSTASDADGLEQPVGGEGALGFLSVNIAEPFSYPLNDQENENEGIGITEVDQQRGFGWASDWRNPSGEDNELTPDIIVNGLVTAQPQEFNPGNFSLKLNGDVGDGIARDIDPISNGEVWVSFTFRDTGPAENHWAGVTLFDSEGGESSFIGKPYNSETSGIGNLPGGDSLADTDYTEAQHYLVRIVLKQGAGQNDHVYLWMNPDETDRLDTYDADGPDEILDIATVKLRRGGASGSAWFDNIWISTDPALPPAGAGRVDLTLNSPDRDPDLPAWDVVSIDQIDDAINDGTWGYGHDNGDNHYLIVTGFIYYTDLSGITGQVVAFGLPADRMSGLNGHVLGPYNNAFEAEGLKNAMKFENNDQQRGPFTFDVVPAGKYKEIKSCMTVGNGDGVLSVTFNYEDGTTEVGEIHADDWYHDPPNDAWNFNDVIVLVNGMNRLSGDNTFDDRFDPGFMEDTTPCNPDKVLESVTLEYNTDISVSFNLFDIFAVPADSETPVSEWALY